MTDGSTAAGNSCMCAIPWLNTARQMHAPGFIMCTSRCSSSVQRDQGRPAFASLCHSAGRGQVRASPAQVARMQKPRGKAERQASPTYTFTRFQCQHQSMPQSGWRSTAVKRRQRMKQGVTRSSNMDAALTWRCKRGTWHQKRTSSSQRSTSDQLVAESVRFPGSLPRSSSAPRSVAVRDM